MSPDPKLTCRVCHTAFTSTQLRYRCEDGHQPELIAVDPGQPIPGMAWCSWTPDDLRDYDMGNLEVYAGCGDIVGLLARDKSTAPIARMALTLHEHGLFEARDATIAVLEALDKVGDQARALAEVWRDMRRLTTYDGSWADVYESNRDWLAARSRVE